MLERRADKKDILELYLNEIYLGQVGSFSINGVGEAARMYFHKDVGNLTLPESALLAGMIQSPNPYNPFRHPQRATERRNLVIRAMNDAGFIDEDDDAEGAWTQPLRGGARHRRHLRGPLLRGPGARPAPRSATTRRTSPPRTSPSTPPSTCPCRRSPRRRSRAASTNVEKMIKRKGERPPVQGSPHRPRARDRRGGGAGGRALLRRPASTTA